MEVLDIVIFSLANITRDYPLVAAALREIFEIEDVNETIHGDEEEIMTSIEHCLALKNDSDAYLDEVAKFMKNYLRYVNIIKSMSAEHMINCVEDDVGTENGLMDDYDDEDEDDQLDDILSDSE